MIPICNPPLLPVEAGGRGFFMPVRIAKSVVYSPQEGFT